MKSNLFFVVFFCFFCLTGYAQTITTFAGNGSASISGDGGPATSAAIAYTLGGCFDIYNNYYFVNGHSGNTVRKVDVAGVIGTVAGNGIQGFAGDNGPATNAQLNRPYGVVTDDTGNIYIADTYNRRIRKVNIATNIIITIAGNGVAGFSGDGGPAINASMSVVTGICRDGFGNIYFIDSSTRIRKIDNSGIITTVAGDGTNDMSGDGGPATNASILALSICTDVAGNIYFGGSGIRKIDVASGIISRFAGNGGGVYNGDEISADSAAFCPSYQLTMDSLGRMYIPDACNHRVRMISNDHVIHTIAGNGVPGFSGDNGPATEAAINHPEGVALDKCGNVYIADTYNKRIRKVATNPNCWPLLVDGEIEKSMPVIYPSPVFDVVHIDKIEGVGRYILTDICGRTVAGGNLQHGDNKIVVDFLAPGIYVLQIGSGNNGPGSNYKVLKE